MEETSKHGVLGRHQSCSEERIEVLSDTIERHHSSRNTPNLLYPESCLDRNWRSHTRKSICVTSTSSKYFLETRSDEGIGFRNCSTIRRRSCSDRVRTGRPVGSEQSIDLFTQREEIDIDFTVSGLQHAVVKQAENFSVRELVKKIQSHLHRQALQHDLQQNNAYNPFSGKSKKMIKERR